MKKILALIIMMALIIGIAGCDDNYVLSIDKAKETTIHLPNKCRIRTIHFDSYKDFIKIRYSTAYLAFPGPVKNYEFSAINPDNSEAAKITFVER